MIIHLSNEEPLDTKILSYTNRLSDFLFAAARFESIGMQETIYQKSY